MSPLPPNSTIGILGGGQLGRMSALAAAELGFRAHIYAPGDGEPGMQVAAARTVAAYEDEAALARFAAAVDVVTFEFENVPARTLEILSPLKPCRPGPKALAVCQDRLQEKAFFGEAGVPVAPWAAVTTEAELHAAVARIGLPAVLKTTRLGYDGRGQAVLRDAADIAPAWERLSPRPLILEAFVPFAQELSAIAARGLDGETAVYDAVENRHTHHILDLSFAPARVPPAVAEAARGHAARVAAALELVGVLAVELFLLPDGTLLGNEIAPRPHNSGHWTQDACQSSQFHQHVRAVAGLPLGSTQRHSDCIMRNLVGPAGMAQLPRFLAESEVSVHLYGKAEAREGRKMGHANRLFPLQTLASEAEALLLSRL
ncbi:5-(carboxyamino)imidazole ribonucleotide synthase [Roseomonas haemaphysalidis]|uniref:N5-carboxyaminoimidazole ribonucleotide synthase n=1 Tax=Roseomonas haemaphysalidis TaxID=2768162 RepID=A0ABS3KNW1_9PROT|nr:5-(carboxyamino)imidazole ribonucleotide synthase [Roseomonas haemaphysalidis]MBO1079148.1 5-(carboxyamino)imidazole ribonucleotide synthase [Roseomonas haemaphysalidis]